MAKGGDLTGKMGGTGFGPAPDGKTPIPFASAKKDAKDPKDVKHPEFKPPRDDKPKKGGGGPTGGAPSSVRPKV